MKILTIYDGTLQAKTTLRYGMRKVTETGGELVVLHVFQSSLFIDYDAGPRAEQIARAEARQHYQDAENIIREAGQAVQIRMVTKEGDPAEELLTVAETEHADIIYATPRYKRITRRAPCPVYIMPGAILVPIDGSDVVEKDLDLIAIEAKLTDSKVLIAGMVPVHLYGKEEQEELENVRKGINASVAKIRKALGIRGLEASAIIRSGYPDDEIQRTADEYAATIIMFPAGGQSPSELTKAAAMLLDEPNSARMPILLLPAEAT